MLLSVFIGFLIGAQFCATIVFIKRGDVVDAIAGVAAMLLTSAALVLQLNYEAAPLLGR